MPSDSITPNAGPTSESPGAPSVEPEEAPATSVQKGAATRLSRAAARRTELLDQMRAQIADGTLVVRQMTEAQRLAASETARRSRPERRGATVAVAVAKREEDARQREAVGQRDTLQEDGIGRHDAAE